MSHALVGKFLTTRPPPSLKSTTLKKYKYIREFYQHRHSILVSTLPVLALSNPNPPQAPEFQHKGVPDIQTSLLSSVSKSYFPAQCFPQWVLRDSHSPMRCCSTKYFNDPETRGKAERPPTQRFTIHASNLRTLPSPAEKDPA